MERPYIICHMTMSLDGKVTGDFLTTPEAAAATEVYYQLNRDYQADAFACGRVTMEGSFTGGWYPELEALTDEPAERVDYAADSDARYFAVAFDRRGRLGWRESCIRDEDTGYDNAHIIEVLCEDAPDAYLAYLRSIGVSYIFAGKRELDMALALRKLKERFGIETLLLEGGSIINGAFARAGVIDELSLVVAPVLAAAEDKPLFENGRPDSWTLRESKDCGQSVLWLDYVRK